MSESESRLFFPPPYYTYSYNLLNLDTSMSTRSILALLSMISPSLSYVTADLNPFLISYYMAGSELITLASKAVKD